MGDTNQTPGLQGGSNKPDCVEQRFEISSWKFLDHEIAAPSPFVLPPIKIDQPCDNITRSYWQASDSVDGFVLITNKGSCAMKVTIEQADGIPPLTDVILPCQTELFSSKKLTGLSVFCSGCSDPAIVLKCLGEAKVIVKNCIIRS